MQVQRLICQFFILSVLVTACQTTPEQDKVSLHTQVIRQNTPSTDWSEYNGDGARSHFSNLVQVTTENVKRLKPAWTYSSVGTDSVLKGTQVQCNPIIVKGVLYGVSPTTQVFALDAATGKEIWKTAIDDNGGTTSRGVTYYEGAGKGRIFFGAGKWLYAIDAETGKLDKEFGSNGKIDLKDGITRPGADNYVVSNTPNTIYKDVIIVGARVSESETALLGDIRAFNVHSGKLVWTFRTIPEPGEPGYESWYPAGPRSRLGGANSWAGMAIDRERGIVYIPTGSAAFDFFGGNRKGNNLYANCLLALDAATGKHLWHFQLVHHDIFDRDAPAPPNLVTVNHNGVKTDAVAQITKQGFVFLFNRVTGEPLFEITEKKVRTDGIAGEYPSPTQPYPLKPKPFTRQEFKENDFSPFVADRDSLVNLLRHARNGGAYTPIGKEMTIFFPDTGGGGHWGGAASDEEGILYVPSKQLPGYTSLVAIEMDSKNVSRGNNKLYNANCSSCHGDDRKGNHDGSYPSLADVNKRLSRDAILQVLEKGRGMMPSFSHLSTQERAGIADFILNKESAEKPGAIFTSNNTAPYKFTGYNRWYDRNGFPVSRPPWGTLTAIDLNTGEHKWQVPLGEYQSLIDKGIPVTGTDNYGGPLVTASGLIFMAGTRDEKFRVFDRRDGRILWETLLPAGGYATPSTYSVKGKQYIVIACGGGKLKTKSGDKYVAFALGE